MISPVPSRSSFGTPIRTESRAVVKVPALQDRASSIIAAARWVAGCPMPFTTTTGVPEAKAKNTPVEKATTPQ